MSEFVTVNTSSGALRGRRVASKAGGSFYSFQGIPYAKPPVGPLRFKVAEPPEPWSGVRDALEEGPICSQFEYDLKKYLGTEDCLYVNVFTTQLPAARPVMVWIHGGGYVMGSGNSDIHGPDYLVKEDIVLVTFNYRVGVLGFLCLEDPAAPGNIGLKDQVAALRWVQKNIASFGGDPNNVTIFGESAGGASVHCQMLSPMSKGLFHRAIAQSGAAFNPWAWEHQPRKMAFRLGVALGCTSEDPQQLVEFLRTVDHSRLVMAATERAKSERDKQRLLAFAFVPTPEVEVEDEERFFPAHPLQLLEEGCYHPLPYITGVASQEAIVLLMFLDLKDPAVHERVNRDFERIVLPELRLPEGYDRPAEACAKLRKFFLQDRPLGPDTVDGFLDMYTELHFEEAVSWTAKRMAERALAPLYVYRFSFDGRLNMLKVLNGLQYPGASHADELGYQFRIPELELEPEPGPDSAEALTRARMVKMWTNFAKTGNPTPEASTLLPVTWLPYTVDDPWYLEIDEELSLGRNLHQERRAFFEELYRATCSE